MIISYKIRLYPTPEQEQIMWDSVNAARFVWNWGLAYQMERFSNGSSHLSGYDMRKILTELKKQDGYEWLNNVSSKTLSAALLDLDDAYQRFFAIQKQGEKYSKSKIKRAARQERKLTPYDMKGHPKFKKKAEAEPKFYVRYDALYFVSGQANIEKIGKVAYRTDSKLPQGRDAAKYTNPRVKYIGGKWILTFGMECESQAREHNDFAVGIDLGVKELAVISYNSGTRTKSYKNINKTKRVKKLKKRLKHKQRSISRKYRQNGSYERTKNVLEEKEQIEGLYRKLANIRLDYTHKKTTEIIELNPRVIVIEDLNVAGMMKNRHLSGAIAEQTLGEFTRQIEYKAKRAGIDVVRADRFYPSSKTCSLCGNIKKDLKLKDRVYRCEVCGLVIDRDINAAKNLEKLVC